MRIQSRKPLSPARRFLGGKMAESLRDIPQLSSYFQLETDTIIAVKNELKAKNQNVTFTSMMARLMADVLRNYPLANSAVLDGDLVIYDSVNIGIAVGLSTGVMPAVIKEAQDKDVFAISDEIKEKTERIKQGALPMADMKGSTFTISSNGLAAFKTATYILNPPETAMLGIDGSEQKLVLNGDGTVSAHGITHMTLSYSHTVLDGYHIRKLYALIKERADNPMPYLGI